MERHTDQVPLLPLIGKRVIVITGRKSKDEVLNTLIDLLAQSENMVPRDVLFRGIFHRESLMSTGIGNGIALPHARLDNLPEPAIAVAICPEGVADYQSPDNIPVKLIFMVAACGDQKTAHLKILSSIGTLFYDGRLKAAFLASPDSAGCLEILARAERSNS